MHPTPLRFFLKFYTINGDHEGNEYILKTITTIISFYLCQLGEATSSSDHTLCGKYINEIAHATNVPPEVIWAVARTESNLGKLGPWPWSVNFKGSGYYFKSRPEMLAFIHKKAKGHHVLNIDIGCMQLNFFYHGDKFTTIDEMTDIYKNMLVASQYLRQLFEVNKRERAKLPDNRIWGYAVGDYHSHRNLRGAQYINRVSKFLMTHPAWHTPSLPDAKSKDHP